MNGMMSDKRDGTEVAAVADKLALAILERLRRFFPGGAFGDSPGYHCTGSEFSCGTYNCRSTHSCKNICRCNDKFTELWPSRTDGMMPNEEKQARQHGGEDHSPEIEAAADRIALAVLRGIAGLLPGHAPTPGYHCKGSEYTCGTSYDCSVTVHSCADVFRCSGVFTE